MNSITKVFVGGMIAAVALVGAPLPQRAEAQAVRVDAESVTDAILNFRNLRATGVRVSGRCS
jgi:hypothetical protein